MRKRVSFSFIAVIILLFVAPLVRAEETQIPNEERTRVRVETTASNEAVRSQLRADKQVMIEQLKAEKKATREANKEERKETLMEKRKDNIQMRFNWRIQHLEAAIQRLEYIAARFETRLGKIGVTRDTMVARTNLASAETQIQLAKVTLEKLKNAFAGVFSSDTPKQTYETAVKPLVEELFKELSAAHQALKMGVGAIKPAPVTPKVTIVPIDEETIVPTTMPVQ